MKKLFYILSAAVLLFSVAFMTACGDKNKPKIGDSGYWEINAPDMIEFARWNFPTEMDNIGPNQIRAHLDNENATFTCTAEHGAFYSQPERLKQRVISAEGSVMYYPEKYPIRQDFVDIVVEDGEHIIGYVVIKVTEGIYHAFTPKLLKSVLFPQIDGEYQEVDREKVEEVIENIKIKNS